MAQNSVTKDFTSSDWADIEAWVEDWVENFLSMHSGTSAPTYAEEGTQWYDTGDNTVYFVDSGANDVPLFEIGTHTGAGLIAASDWDMNGNDLILDADADSKIVCDTDDEMSIELGGAEEFLFTAAVLDIKGNTIKAPEMAANTNTPSGATDYQIVFQTSAGVDVMVPGYLAASAWTV